MATEHHDWERHHCLSAIEVVRTSRSSSRFRTCRRRVTTACRQLRSLGPCERIDEVVDQALVTTACRQLRSLGQYDKKNYVVAPLGSPLPVGN